MLAVCGMGSTCSEGRGLSRNSSETISSIFPD